MLIGAVFSHYYPISGVIASRVIYTLHQRRAEIWLSEIEHTWGLSQKWPLTFSESYFQNDHHFSGWPPFQAVLKSIWPVLFLWSTHWNIHFEVQEIPSVMLPLWYWHFGSQPQFNSTGWKARPELARLHLFAVPHTQVAFKADHFTSRTRDALVGRMASKQTSAFLPH